MAAFRQLAVPLSMVFAIFGCEPQEPERAATVAAPTTGAVPAAASRGDWPLFRGNSRSTGVAKTSLPAEPVVLLKYKAPEKAFEATAVIAG